MNDHQHAPTAVGAPPHVSSHVRHSVVDHQKRDELNRVELELANAQNNLRRLKRYWSQLDDGGQAELYDRLKSTPPPPQSVSSPAAAAAAAATRNSSTANKVKKKIIVGNTSTYIPEDHREETDQYTHKWMIYVRGPKEEPEMTWVKKVRIQIHPSFAPNDVVDLHNPPFHLSRRGYGEFPVQVQLYFHDSNTQSSGVRNDNNQQQQQPGVTIVHQLTLDKEATGKQVIHPETITEIEIDGAAIVPQYSGTTTATTDEEQQQQPAKKIKTSSSSQHPTTAPAAAGAAPAAPSAVSVTSAAPGAGGVVVDSSSSSSSIMIVPSHPCMKYDNRLILDGGESAWSSLSEEERLIVEVARKFPLIVQQDTATATPYLSARSNEEFMSWTIGKRKAAERFRALYVKKYIMLKYDHCRDVTTAQVCRICRRAGLSPIVVQSDALGVLQRMIDPRRKNYTTSTRYCKYCGTAHSSFDRMQDKCRQQHYVLQHQLYSSSGGNNNNNGSASSGSNSSDSSSIHSWVQSWPLDIDSTITELSTIPVDPRTREQSVRARQPGPPLSRGYAKVVDGCHELYREECGCVRRLMAQVGIVDHYYHGNNNNSASGAQQQHGGISGSRLSATESTQGKIVDLMLVKALESFAKSLIQSSMHVFHAQQQQENGGGGGSSMDVEDGSTTTAAEEKILTPVHVYRAVVDNPDSFDFLANNTPQQQQQQSSRNNGVSAGAGAL